MCAFFGFCFFQKKFRELLKNKKKWCEYYGSSNFFHTFYNECTEIKNHFAKITESIWIWQFKYNNNIPNYF
jgi:hypothetical protein